MQRSTIVLLALFAVFGILYWYMQNPGNAIKQALATSTTTAPTESLSNLLRPDQGPVSSISIQQADGKKVTLKHAGGIWLITTDSETPANQDASDAIAQGVMSLRMIAKLEKAPDLSSFGLNKPAYTISLVLVDGSPYVLKIGAATVTDSGYYVQANDGSIVVIDKTAIDALTTMVAEPPLLQIVTPSPAPATDTPTPTFMPESTSAPNVTSTAKP